MFRLSVFTVKALLPESIAREFLASEMDETTVEILKSLNSYEQSGDWVEDGIGISERPVPIS